MSEVVSNPRLLVPYLDLSSDISSFHDEDSRSSVISSDSTSSASSMVRVFMYTSSYRGGLCVSELGLFCIIYTASRLVIQNYFVYLYSDFFL